MKSIKILMICSTPVLINIASAIKIHILNNEMLDGKVEVELTNENRKVTIGPDTRHGLIEGNGRAIVTIFKNEKPISRYKLEDFDYRNIKIWQDGDFDIVYGGPSEKLALDK